MYIFNIMNKNKKEYNSKIAKLKTYSRGKLYNKVYPTLLRQSIPQTFLTTEGITKETILKDTYRLVGCCNNISYKKVKKLVRTYKGERLMNEQVLKETKIFNTNQCNIFSLCPVCAEKISRRHREKHRDQINYLINNSKYVYMVTFTTRDETSFNLSYYRLTEAIRKYVLMGQKRTYGNSGGEFSKIKAMVISKEIKLGENSKRWHVHGHGLMFADQEIDYKIYDINKKREILKKFKEMGKTPEKKDLNLAVMKWGTLEVIDYETGEIVKKKIPVSKASDEWINATDGTSANIKFSPIKHPDMNMVRPQFRKKHIDKSCHEVIKYTSKIADFNAEQIVEILINRKEKRFFSTYGALYDYWDKNPRSKTKVEEAELQLLDLRGYVWSNKKNVLIPMNKEQREQLKQRYKNSENLKKAQSEIMKGYYIKEDMIKKIMAEYMEQLETEKKKNARDRVRPKVAEMRRMNVIRNIDDLNGAYILFKRETFKKYMGVPRGNNKNIKYTGIQNAFFIKTERLVVK